jgi:hypothetical protein
MIAPGGAARIPVSIIALAERQLENGNRDCL